MADPLAHVWSTADFAHIITQQHQLEDELAGRANRVLICDTDAFTTCVFHDVYLGQPAPADLTAQIRRYDLYLLTDPATPFEQDTTGLRGAEARNIMHEAYQTMLTGSNARHIEVSGTPVDRLDAAVGAVNQLLSEPVVLRG
jgi:nicotinamide riboside kinase